MEDLQGTYRGFTPTDESAVGVGEMQIIINTQRLSMLIATGLKVQEDHMDLSDVHELRPSEIAAEFNDGADIDGVRGFRLGDTGVRLLFLRPPEPPGLIVRGLFGEEAFGHSMLLTPQQIEDGLFDETIREVEEAYGKNLIPLIAHGGIAQRNPEADKKD